MELYQLQTFVIVAEEQSITGAARRLYTTPSTISMHIKSLEDELHVQLFIRTSRGMQITDKGKLLHPRAVATLTAAQDFVNHATEMQAYLLGSATIGLNASPTYLRIPALIESLQRDCPGIDLIFQKSSSENILEGVRAGQFDLGFVFGELDTSLFEHHPLTQTELVIAAPAAWQAQVEGASWGDLAAMAWIDIGSKCPFQKIISQQFETRNLSYQRMVQADDEQTRFDLVAAGVGLSLLEKSEAQSEQIFIWESDPLVCDLSLIYGVQHKHHPIISTVAQQILMMWAG